MEKYKSTLLEAVHETAKGLHQVHAIDNQAMRNYDALCLNPVPSYTSSMIRKIRKQHQLTQAVLASLLNTSISTVQKWEIGDKKPSGQSNKLLYLLEKNGLDAML